MVSTVLVGSLRPVIAPSLRSGRYSPKPLGSYWMVDPLVSVFNFNLGYVKRGSTAFKVQKDGCDILSAARALLGPEGLLMR